MSPSYVVQAKKEDAPAIRSHYVLLILCSVRQLEFMEVKTININENQELAMKTLNLQLCKKDYISELVLQLLKDS